MLSPELQEEPFTQPPDNRSMLQMQKCHPKHMLQRDPADFGIVSYQVAEVSAGVVHGDVLCTTGYGFLYCSPYQTSCMVSRCSQDDEEPFIFPADIPALWAIPNK